MSLGWGWCKECENYTKWQEFGGPHEGSDLLCEHEESSIDHDVYYFNTDNEYGYFANIFAPKFPSLETLEILELYRKSRPLIMFGEDTDWW